jgi:dTMP kinase
MKRADTGLLIAFEGIDGAGKTTQVTRLAELCRRRGEIVVTSKEPTSGKWGMKIRESAQSGRMSLEDELAAFIEDRKEHVRELILPSLKRSETVILDRYFHSTIAYQGARGADVAELESKMDAIAPNPDVVILLDVDPVVGLSRIREGRNETPNTFEQLEGLSKSRGIFQGLANTLPNFIRVDGMMSMDAVHKEIVTKLVDGPLKRKWCAKSYGCDDPGRCSFRYSDSCRWARFLGFDPAPVYRDSKTK